MNYQTLRNTIVQSGALLTISRNTLDENVGQLLDAFFQSQPLVLDSVEVAPEDDAGQTVLVRGRSSFLQVAELPVTARFSVGADGKVQALLKYKLRDELPGPAAWTFSRSFPKLPAVLHHAQGFPIEESAGSQEPYVDSLDLFDTYFVVTTQAGVDPDFAVPLEPGINFVSKLRPQGMIGILESALKTPEPLVLYGPIRLPSPTGQTLPRTLFQRIWDRPDAPGIHVKAPLDLDFQLGKLRFDRPCFRVYSPPSTDWLAQNSSFQPAHGYTGRLAIPSAGIELELSADLQWGLPRAYLYAQCEGVSLGKLTHLGDLVGEQDLSAGLPDELRSAVDKLEKLELLALGAAVDFAAATLHVSSLSVTIGMPSLVWKVWSDRLVVENISCRFDLAEPFTRKPSAAAGGRSSLAVTVSGIVKIEGVPLRITARSDRNFSLYAMLQDGQTIPLGALLNRYAPSLPAPSDLTIDSLAVTVTPGQFYAMAMSLASQPKPWMIPIGRRNIALSGLSLNLLSPQGGPVSGSFAGTAALSDELSLSMSWTIGQSLVLRGVFANVKLQALIKDLCDQLGELPPKFDLTLTTAQVLVSQRGSDFAFQLASEIDGLGTLAFEVRKLAAGGVGFAGGLSLVTASSPAKVPGLAALTALERALRLQKFLLVFSSFSDVAFVFPDLAQFNSPQLATKKVALPQSASGLAAGLNAYAQWQLDSADKHHGLIQKLLGLDGTLDVAVQIGQKPENSRLLVAKSGKIAGRPFQYKLGVQLDNGQPSLFLTGSVPLTIQGQPQTFDLTTLFVANGAFLSANVKGTKPIDFKLFKLSNLGLEIGVDLAGLPSLGVTGTIDVKNFESSVAVFFDSTDPTKSLVAGAVSDISLKDVVDTLLGTKVRSAIDEVLASVAIKGTAPFNLPGALAADLDQLRLDKVAAAFLSGGSVQIPAAAQQVLLSANTPGELWHLTDLTKMRHYQLKKVGQTIQASLQAQFYFAPQATAIGTIPFPQGFYISGAIEFLGYRAQATVDISANRGIRVDAEMDKIILGNGLFAITAASGSGGPKVSISTMADPGNQVPELRPPHFYVSGAAQLLGIRAVVLASLTTKGLLLELKGGLAPGVTFDLDLELGKGGLSVDGDIKTGIGTIDLGTLGKVKVNTELEGSLGIRIGGAQLATAVEASFSFLGEEKNVAKFELDKNPSALARLAGTLESKVTALLREEFKDAGRWASAVKRGAIDGVDDAEKVLRNVYGKSSDEAKELAGTAKKEVSSVVNSAGKTASKFGKKIKKLF